MQAAIRSTAIQLVTTCCILAAGGCTQTPQSASMGTPSLHAPLVANISSGDDQRSFDQIRDAFRVNNPGYDIDYETGTSRLEAGAAGLVVFIQRTATIASITPSGEQSEIDVGDILMLRPGQAVTTDEPIGCLVFSVPDPFPDNLPSFIRPDWDDQITDVVGGCATETGAYRRILLTWLDSVGPYTYHALNAHRVRITDSFTHYHPVVGGFDEFYLVQMVQPNARIITSASVDLIEHPERVTPEDAASLLYESPLAVGDLVYLPRGLAHRGIDGVLAQVITTPGFRPNAEIGLDHHLRAINERLQLKGERALPFHMGASLKPVVK